MHTLRVCINLTVFLLSVFLALLYLMRYDIRCAKSQRGQPLVTLTCVASGELGIFAMIRLDNILMANNLLARHKAQLTIRTCI